MSEEYLLNRDSDESRRLEVQHKLWTDTLDYLIHPSIAAKLPATAQIADVATGTGAWPVGVAKVKPNYKITGFDISNAQYPPSSTLPANVILKTHDLRQSFPADLQGRFDVVHLRLLVFAMSDQKSWNTAVTNVSALLKPGGWLQWEEGDFTTSMRHARAGAAGSVSSEAWKRGTNFYINMAGDRGYNVPEKLVAAFEHGGFGSIDTDTVASDRLGMEASKTATKLQAATLEGTQKQFRAMRGQVPPLEKSEEEDAKLVAAMEEEAEKGLYVIYFIICVTGRKES